MPAYITVNTTAEAVCFLLSLACLYKDKEPAWRLFIFFLLTTVIVEMGGIYVRDQMQLPNYMIYNVFLLIECLVQYYFFYFLYKTYHDTKKLLIGWLIAFALFYFAELISKHFGAYVSVSSTVMSVGLILASVYFYYLLLREKRSRQLAAYAPFWWVNGTICFYFAGIACNLFFRYLVQDQTPGVGHSARYIVFSMLNVLLYLNWSYAFICRYRQRISSSSSD
ncbi:hypothetical protein HQ865_13260 [Mucilaginibacter mali]|uniref:Uncharacterized protein n=1 Tax=Mucilaginibacter mali TaxID=2740462 RepID=A0A7D4UM29_9SPHI|nr:hypothetical protein [Mucilaginibacter mali]QKJ30681.1 hypothetical protein HQ865_13260 [Mucilaginibacter mali]